MIGAVFLAEMTCADRRGRQRRLRALYATLLLAELLLLLYSWCFQCLIYHSARRATAETALGYFEFFTAQTTLLLVLVTPALAAGSVADDKARGTLALLLTTDLAAGEIIIGKWLAQVALVLLLALPAAPIILFLAACAGMPAGGLLAWAAESVLLAMALAAAALLGSVWSRRTYSAVLTLYLAGGAVIWLLGWAGLGTGLGQLAYQQPQNWLAGQPWWSPGGLAALAGLTALCLAVAAWRLRPAHAAQLEGAARAGRWLARPGVGDSPLRWKERFAGELGPLSALRRLPHGLRLVGVAAVSLLAGAAVRGDDAAVLTHGLALMLVTGLIVAARASSAITAEREKQTWEGLLMTPLRPYDLVRGKLWGIIDSVRPYLGVYLLAGLPVALAGGWWPTLCLVYCWLASWALLYYMGANGLYWSARSAGSWQSLLGTLGSAIRDGVSRSLVVFTVGAGAVMLSILLGPVIAWLADLGLFGGVFSRSAAYHVIVLLGFVTPLLVILFADAEDRLTGAEQHIQEWERGGRTDLALPPAGLLARRAPA